MFWHCGVSYLPYFNFVIITTSYETVHFPQRIVVWKEGTGCELWKFDEKRGKQLPSVLITLDESQLRMPKSWALSIEAKGEGVPSDVVSVNSATLHTLRTLSEQPLTKSWLSHVKARDWTVPSCLNILLQWKDLRWRLRFEWAPSAKSPN